MSKFTLFDKEIVFSDSQDRFIALVEMIPEIKNDARDYFRKVYEERWSDIEDVLEEYDTATITLISHMLKDKLYRYLIDADIYDISEDSMIESCWDTSSADEAYDIIAEAYNDIIDDYEEEIEYRRSRKENRGKVIGGGFGFSGAVKGMAMAGAMNAASGLGHSIVNAFGNLKSSLDADNAKEELFESSETYKLLENGVISSIVATIQTFISFINNYRENEGEGVWFDGSQFDVKRAETLLVNALRFQEKKKELLFKAFILCPYHPDILKAIFADCESERQNVVEICNVLNIDLQEIYEKVIDSMYPSKDGNYDEDDDNDEYDEDDVVNLLLRYVRNK